MRTMHFRRTPAERDSRLERHDDGGLVGAIGIPPLRQAQGSGFQKKLIANCYLLIAANC